MAKKIKYILLLTVALNFLACSSTPVNTEYFTLHAKSGWDESVSLNKTFALGVGPVILPESLDAPGIVTLAEKNQLNISTRRLWAGDLKKSVTRVIADNISEITAMPQVWSHPWDGRQRPEKQVAVVVEQLQGALGGTVVLKAKWRVLESYGNTSLGVYAEQFSVETRGKGYGDYAVAVNDLMNQLSLRIAKTLSQTHWQSDER